MEIHGILDNDEAIIGPDGKICRFVRNRKKEKSDNVKSNLVCSECDLKFSTRKTLTYHIKYKHNVTRTVYPCPDCKDTFANAWCVYRHLYKVHRKTSTQIRKLREIIHNSAIRKDQQPINKKDKKQVQERTDDENQWLKNVEGDNDLQMCGGCGKRFERKAALYSHSQMCIKRIAVCNTIKENTKPKRDQEENEDFKEKYKLMKSEKENNMDIIKGSKKRKPVVLISYKNVAVEDKNEKGANIDHKANTGSKSNSTETKHMICSHEYSNPSTDEEDYTLDDSEVTPYPLIDILDTESMMNIIGIPSKSIKEIISSQSDNETYVSSGIESEIFDDIEHKQINMQLLPQMIETEIQGGTDTLNSKSRITDTSQKDCDRSKIQCDADYNQTEKVISLDGTKVVTKDNSSHLVNISQNRIVKKECALEQYSFSDRPDINTNQNVTESGDFTVSCNISKADYSFVNAEIDICNVNTLSGVNNVNMNFCTDINMADIDMHNSTDVTNVNNVSDPAIPETASGYDKIGNSMIESTNYFFKNPETDSMSVKNITHEIRDRDCEFHTNFSSEDVLKNDTDVSKKPDVIVIDDDDSDISQNKSKIEYVVHSVSALEECEPETNETPDVVPSSTSLKRKRTISLDCSSLQKNKAVKIIDANEVLTDEHDVSFIAKATPYMNQKDLSCISCDVTYPSLYQLLWHMSQHFSWFRFQCSRCSFMSFNKYECAKHAKKNHNSSQSFIDSIVLPIPNWKTVLMSHDFCYINLIPNETKAHALVECEDLSEFKNINNHSDIDSDSDECFNGFDNEEKHNPGYSNYNSNKLVDNGLPPHSVSKSEHSENCEDTLEVPSSSYSETKKNSIQKKVLITEQAFFKKNDSVNESTEGFRNVGKLKRDLYLNRKINENSSAEFSSVDSNYMVENVRPVRNRTKSVKTIQNDFLYNLNNVLQLNNLNQPRRKTDIPSRKSPDSKVLDSKMLRVYSRSNSNNNKIEAVTVNEDYLTKHST